jgi:cobalt-zinc-cadmium efflux system outer membrane protein
MKICTACAIRACWIALALLAPAAEADAAPDGLTLREAISAALADNPDLSAFAYGLRTAQARERQAALRPAPELAIEAENFAGSGETRAFDAAETTLALSQVIELGGKRDARVDLARAGSGAVEIERQAAQLDVLAEVTRRFITVARAQERLSLARSATALGERRADAAKSPHAELDRAQIARDRDRLEEQAAAADLDTARKQLAAMWGASQPVIDGRSFGEVKAELFALPPTGDFAALAGQLAANPDFLRFASEARLRDAELRLATTLRRPDVTLSGGLRRFENSGDQAFVVSLSLPLFSGRRAEAYVAEAQANRERVDAQRRAAEVRAEATLYELHRQLARAVNEARALGNDIRPRAAEALQETEDAYARGRYSYLELVDAQREYLSVQAALIESAATAHALRTEIERLTNAPLSAGSAAAAEVDDRHAGERQRDAGDVRQYRSLSVDAPQPAQRDGDVDVDAAIGRVDPPAGLRMQGQQPDEQRKTDGRGQQQPGTAAVSQPQPRQVAAEDFGDRRQYEQTQRLRSSHSE